MTCSHTIPDLATVKLFMWIANNKTCDFRTNHTDTKVVCESKGGQLSLTVLNVMPADQGDYLCKVHSDKGVKSKKTVLTIQSVSIFFF